MEDAEQVDPAGHDHPPRHQCSGGEVQGHLTETWLNDVLADAQELGVPGPTRVNNMFGHAKPILRYGIDRQSLHNFSLPSQMHDRIYRSLFVHSIGFFRFLKEITSSIDEGRAALRTTIWRVFQVLLECACQTDYKLVTQQMEEEKAQEVADLMERNNELTKQCLAKEDELQHRLRKVAAEQDQVALARAKFDDERQRVLEELTNL